MHVKICLKSDRPNYCVVGLPEYGVDPFDPFYANEIHQKRSGPFFNYRLVLRNVTEAGWTQSQVTRFRYVCHIITTVLMRYIPSVNGAASQTFAMSRLKPKLQPVSHT